MIVHRLLFPLYKKNIIFKMGACMDPPKDKKGRKLQKNTKPSEGAKQSKISKIRETVIESE